MLTVLLLSILTPIIVFGIFGFFIYGWYTNAKLQSVVPETTTFLFRFNPKDRKVMPYNIIPERKNAFRGLKPGHWGNVDLITNHFRSSEAKKKIRLAFNDVEMGKKVGDFSFISTFSILKKGEYKFDWKIDQIANQDEYILRISWKKMYPQETLADFKDNLIDKKTVIENNLYKYKGFVAFNLYSETSTIKLLDIINRIYQKQDIQYFIHGGFVVVCFFEPSAKRMKKQIDAFVKRFKNHGFKMGANHLFDGSAFAASNNVDNPKHLSLMLQTLDFLINISIKIKRNFISYKENLNKEEFIKFSEASKSFRLAVRAGNIDSKVLSIRYWKSKKKSIDYIVPHVDGIHPNTLDEILINKNNKDMLIDAHAQLVAVEGKYDKAVMVDVNSNWLIENRDQLAYKKSIYLINMIDDNTTELQQIVNDLNEKGFVFAMRISKYTEEVITVVQRIHPDFLVIDSSFWNDNKLFDSGRLINLMSLKKVSDENNIKIIFEQPSDLIDDETAKKIGLKYFYNFE